MSVFMPWFLLFLATAAAVCVTTTAAAAVTAPKKRWKSTNPGGGGALNSPVLTSDGKHWVVGSDLGGIYYSLDDNGSSSVPSTSSWAAAGSNRGLTATHVASMAALSGNKIAVGTDDGIYVGTVGGTFRRAYPSGYASAVAVSADPDVVYAAVHPTYDGLSPEFLRSSDGGTTWTKAAAENLPSSLRITAIRAHPVDSEGVWLLSGEGRFNESPGQAWFSADGGTSWTRMDPRKGEVIDVTYAMDENNLNRMYLTTEESKKDGRGRFFVSDDTGFSWEEKALAPSRGITGIVLPDASNPNRVRVIDFNYRSGTSTSYLWESQNGGTTWTRSVNKVVGGWSRSDEDWGLSSSFQGYAQTVGYRPDRPNEVLWVNSQFVYKSSNGGKTWADAVSQERNKSGVATWRSRRIDNVVPVVVEPSAANPKLVYAGFMDMGVWRSDDGGVYWRDLNPGARYTHNWGGKGGNTLSVVADPQRSNVVWAQIAGDLEDPLHLMKSTNKGNTWKELKKGLPKKLTLLEGLSLAKDSATKSRWLYVVANGDVYLSRNDGSNWSKVLRCLGKCFRAWYTNSGVYAVGPGGVWRSWKGGRANTWRKIRLPTAASRGWTRGQHWLHDSWTYVGPMDLAARGSKEVWLAIKGKGLYYSGNSGTTWKKVNGNPHVRTVAVDTKSKKVFLGSSSALQAGGYEANSLGIRVHKTGRTNKGWKAMNQGLAYPFATSVTIAKSGQRWLISPGQGVMKWS